MYISMCMYVYTHICIYMYTYHIYIYNSCAGLSWRGKSKARTARSCASFEDVAKLVVDVFVDAGRVDRADATTGGVLAF